MKYILTQLNELKEKVEYGDISRNQIIDRLHNLTVELEDQL